MAHDEALPGLAEAHDWFEQTVDRVRANGFDATDYLNRVIADFLRE